MFSGYVSIGFADIETEISVISLLLKTLKLTRSEATCFRFWQKFTLGLGLDFDWVLLLYAYVCVHLQFFIAVHVCLGLLSCCKVNVQPSLQVKLGCVN